MIPFRIIELCLKLNLLLKMRCEHDTGDFIYSKRTIKSKA
jgi:hypothetical protein